MTISTLDLFNGTILAIQHPERFRIQALKTGGGYSTGGDGWYQSGSWSKKLIDISEGVVVEFRVKQEAGYIWDMFNVIGFGRLQGEYRENYWPYYFRVAILGHNPDANPPSTDDIHYSVYISEYIEEAANDHQFHTFKVIYDGFTNDVEFYKDDMFIVKLNAGPRPYDELPLLIVGRDSMAQIIWIGYVYLHSKNRNTSL